MEVMRAFVKLEFSALLEADPEFPDMQPEELVVKFVKEHLEDATHEVTSPNNASEVCGLVRIDDVIITVGPAYETSSHGTRRGKLPETKR